MASSPVMSLDYIWVVCILLQIQHRNLRNMFGVAEEVLMLPNLAEQGNIKVSEMGGWKIEPLCECLARFSHHWECHVPFTHAICTFHRVEKLCFAFCSCAIPVSYQGLLQQVSWYSQRWSCSHWSIPSSHHAEALFSALSCSLGIWTWNRNLRVYANVLMMLFAYLEVIYKTMHMELLKTWHQQFVEDHGSTQQKLNIQLVFASSRREAVQFWRLLKRVCQWRKTLESLHKFQPCPRGKHPAMHCLSLHSCCFKKSGQLQLVLAVGTALLNSLRSSPGAVLCWSLIYTVLADSALSLYKTWRCTTLKYMNLGSSQKLATFYISLCSL